jgi:hypothetical protein
MRFRLRGSVHESLSQKVVILDLATALGGGIWHAVKSPRSRIDYASGIMFEEPYAYAAI